MLQDCVLYLCGTKYDLVEENKKSRKIDASMTKEYADGMSIKCTAKLNRKLK